MSELAGLLTYDKLTELTLVSVTTTADTGNAILANELTRFPNEKDHLTYSRIMYLQQKKYDMTMLTTLDHCRVVVTLP